MPYVTKKIGHPEHFRVPLSQKPPVLSYTNRTKVTLYRQLSGTVVSTFGQQVGGFPAQIPIFLPMTWRCRARRIDMDKLRPFEAMFVDNKEYTQFVRGG